MRRSGGALAVSVAIHLVAGQAVHAAISGAERIATGLDSPLYATHAPEDPDRLFVLEKGGQIKIVDLQTKSVTGTFLDIDDTDAESEGGLLGLAFHPQYAQPETPGYGKFYTYVTVDNDGDDSLGPVSPFSSHIRQYTVEGDPLTSNTADPASQREILSFVQPQANHNAGWIGFSPHDDYLYIASGDGGAGGDNAPGHTSGIGNAQDISDNLLGKMLRIDVDGDDFPDDDDRNYAIPGSNPFVGETGDDEIWAYGLRNPFRNGFDRVTGDLWIADVGQSAYEEIDVQAAASEGGENYGWRLYEGDATFAADEEDDPPDDYVGPLYDYPRGFGTYEGRAVIGGYVYRGPDPTLQGTYFFADQVSQNKWTLDPENPQESVANIGNLLSPDVGSIGGVASFGEDANGNLYLLDYAGNGNGEVYRIATDALIDGDYDADGDVDHDDYEAWKSSFGSSTELAADGNGNNVVDAADYTVWRDNFGSTAQDIGGAAAGATTRAAAPEPSTWLLVAAALSVVLASRELVASRGQVVR